MKVLLLAPGCTGYKMLELYSHVFKETHALGEEKYKWKFKRNIAQSKINLNIKFHYASTFGYFFKALEIAKKYKPDFILTHDPKSSFWAYLVSKLTKIPVVTQMCQDFIEYLRLHQFNPIKKSFIIQSNLFVLKYLYPSFKVIALSQHIKKKAQEYGMKNIEVIPVHGIDCEKFYPKKVEKQKTIITVARLTPEKGVKYLLDAFNEIQKEFPLKLILIGDGYQMDEFKKYVKKLKIQDKVIFKGFVDHNKLVDHYNQAELFALPSLKEGLGYVSGEAMACKIPVVASNTGGIPDIVINEKTGLLVKPESVKELEIAIKRILTNKELKNKLIKQGYEHIKNNFEEKVVTEKFKQHLINLTHV